MPILRLENGHFIHTQQGTVYWMVRRQQYQGKRVWSEGL